MKEVCDDRGESRERYLLRVCLAYLESLDEDSAYCDALIKSLIYDGAECDGLCLIEDIRDVVGKE